jgi:peptidyl-dipeptidase Dcp
MTTNLFLELYQYVSFDVIKPEHYESAILEGIKWDDAEIQQITSSLEKPNFINTILAFEKSGRLLKHVKKFFENIRKTESTEDLLILVKINSMGKWT